MTLAGLRAPFLAVGLVRDERGQSLVIVLTLVTLFFLLGSALAAHASVALRATAANEGQGNEFWAADGATELGIWWQRNGQAGNPPPQTLNGLTTSTTITSAGGGSCPTPPTPTFVTGNEYGVLSTNQVGIWSAISGSASVSSLAARTGSYSLRMSPSGVGGGFAYVNKGTSGTTVVARFSIYVTTYPTLDPNELVYFQVGAGNPLYLRYDRTLQKFALQMGATGPRQVSSSTVTTGTWYDFDVRFNIGTNPRTADWQLNGVPQTQVSSAEATATSIGYVAFGNPVGSNTYTVYYDDIMLSQTSGNYPIGETKVSALVPNQMGLVFGSLGDLVNNDGTNLDSTSPGRVDDVPMTSATDYVKQVRVAGTSYATFAFQDTTESCLRNAVFAVLAYHSAGTTANNGKTSIFDGATERVLFPLGDMSESALWYRGAMMTAASSPWTQAAVNGLLARVGYSTDVSPNPYWDALMLEYAWRPNPATEITVVGTAGGSTVTTTYPNVGAGTPTLSTWTTTK